MSFVDATVIDEIRVDDGNTTFSITSVDTTNNIFGVDADPGGLAAGDVIFVYGSTANDQEYTVASVDTVADEITVNESISDGTVDGKITHGNFQYVEFGDAQIENNDPTFSHGAGFDQELGAFKTLTVPLHVKAAFDNLDPLQTNNPPDLVAVIVRFKTAGYDVLEPAILRGSPLLSPTADQRELWIAPTGTTGDPTTNTANWTSLGRTIGFQDPDTSVGTREDGLGRGRFASAQLEHIVEYDPANKGTADTFEDQDNRVAIEHPNGEYRIYEGVRVEARYMHETGTDQIRSAMLRIFGADDEWSDLLTFPSTIAEFTYGFELEADGFAYNESSIFQRV